jgi:hypothetical protein
MTEGRRRVMEIRRAAVVAVMAGLVVGLAGPASAEGDTLSGTYTADQGDRNGPEETWQFTPCGPGCTSLAVVSPTDPKHRYIACRDVGVPSPRELHLQDGTWHWTNQKPQSPGFNSGCALTIDSGTLYVWAVCGDVMGQISG